MAKYPKRGFAFVSKINTTITNTKILTLKPFSEALQL